METTAEQLIRDKSFDALSQEELLVVQELCDSEEEFQSMKQFFREMEQLTLAEKTVVSPAIKESLDNIFAAKHPGIRANWSAPAAAEVPHAAKVVPLYQRKWVRIAAVFVLTVGTIPFWLMFSENEAMKTVPSVQVAKNERPKTYVQATAQSPVTKQVETSSNASSDGTPVVKSEATYRTVSQPVFLDKMADFESASAAEDVSAASTDRDVEAFMGSVSAPLNAVSPVTYSFSSGNMASGFTSTATAPQDGVLFSKPSNFGMMADLNPEGRTRFQLKYVPQSPLAASLDQQPDELLDLLVPAF